MAVLCPPHLVEQWQGELQNERFHLQAVAVTASSAARLERGLPHGESIVRPAPPSPWSASTTSRATATATTSSAPAPECIIVDEAHTCASTGAGRQQRFELLRAWPPMPSATCCCSPPPRTAATRNAFHSLLALLKPEFAQLATSATGERNTESAARAAWRCTSCSAAARTSTNGTTAASSRSGKPPSSPTASAGQLADQFFQDVLDYCARSD
jgi:hypothetical protein